MARNRERPPSRFKRELRVLVVEDDPPDAELMVAMLKRVGYGVSHKVVDSLEGFHQEVEQGGYDLILADYNLRTWTGTEALEALRQTGNDIPFVVVTGTLGDEAAVECIKQGATDYVLKHRLQRLPVVVERALRDKAHRGEAARLEEQIRRGKREWELTFDTVPDPIFVLSPDFHIQRANRAAAELLKLECPQLPGRACFDLVHGQDRPVDQCPHLRMMRTGKQESEDLELPRLGKIFHVTASPLRNNGGDVRGCVHVMRDITKRKRAEEALRESELRYRRLFESAKDGILILEIGKGKIVDCNPYITELLGYSKQELLGKELHEIGFLQDQTDSMEAFQKLQQAGYVTYDDLPLVSRSGKQIDVEFVSNVYDVGDQQVVQCNIRNITDRKLAKEALQRSEASYRSLILGASYGIFRCDVEGKFQPVNPALVSMQGYASENELLARNLLHDIIADAEEGVRLLQQYRQKGRVDGVESRWKRQDGSALFVRLSGRTVLGEGGALEGFEVIAEDVRERRRLEEQLRQAQKMEAVGRLAGGIAHDFNNLLTVVTGYNDLLLANVKAEDGVRGYLEEIKRAAERATDLTRQLLAFSRKQVLAPQVLDLNAVVAGMDKMLRHVIGEDIDLATVLEPRLGRVKADPGQVEQVLMNLAVNARDAMPQGGKLTLTTANVDLDRTYTLRHILTAPGPHVMLAVSDTGCGMDSETLNHLFEPFFTTKEPGRGTGLGLAMVYGIVQQSGGNIWVYSEPGKGSTFKIYLPRVQESATREEPREASEVPTQGSEVVLVVEDDAAVRPLVRGLLGAHGYKVLIAPGPEEALRICADHKESIDLLLTDLVMPKMSGRQLAERLVSLRPKLKVLYMSGYTDDAIVHHGVLEKGTAFLQKPFTPGALARKVREVLDAPA